MTGWDWGIDFFLILLACIGADLFIAWWKKIREPDLGCDWCEQIKNLYRTPDHKWWFCKKCMESYLKDGGFSESEKQAVRSKYKAVPSKKIMPKKKKRKLRTEEK